jgi:hypothetical protein
MGASQRYTVTTDADAGLVEAWSAERLPFEPKGWLLQLRAELRAALKRLTSSRRSVLSALYGSPVRGFCDPENVLIYNVGPGHVSAAAAGGLRVERSYNCPCAPESLECPAEHYWRYRAAPVDEEFSAWREGRLVAAWSRVPMPPLSETIKPGAVWFSMRCAPISIAGSADPAKPFGLRLVLGLAPGERVAPAKVVKPLVDGAVSALHSHDGSALADLAKRMRSQLPATSPERIAALLLDDASAALGRRRLLWPRAESVHWNPADDSCHALALRVVRSERRELSGRLVEIEPR